MAVSQRPLEPKLTRGLSLNEESPPIWLDELEATWELFPNALTMARESVPEFACSEVIPDWAAEETLSRMPPPRRENARALKGDARPMRPLFPFSPATAFAPMEGITHREHRELIASYGPLGLAYTEFLRVSRAPLDAKLVRSHAEGTPGVALAVQLMGNEPEKMGEAARIASQSGADVVDVNLGCPTSRAARHGVGASLLAHPQQVKELLCRVREQTSVKMSVKMRAGVTTDLGVEFGELAESIGVDFIILHPRTSRAQYTGVADHSKVAQMVHATRLPVVANGDLWYAEDALRLARETGAAAVMIGRPALRNPWIFRQIDELSQGKPAFAPTGNDVIAHLERLAALFAERLPRQAKFQTDALKQQLSWVARGIPDQGELGRQALRLPSVATILDLCRRSLSFRKASDLDLEARGRYALERTPEFNLDSTPKGPNARSSRDLGGAMPQDR